MRTEIDIDTMLSHYNTEIAKLTQRALIAEAIQEELEKKLTELDGTNGDD